MSFRRGCLAGFGLLTLAGATGCGVQGDEREARETVDRLRAAFEAKDAALACRQLTEDTRQSLEKSAGAPCRRAILDEDIDPGPVVSSTVYITSAEVRLDDGQVVFLDKTPDGWRIDAAGCTPRGAKPADCEVEA